MTDDRADIHDLYARYVSALNTKAYELFDTVFLPDAVVDATAFGGIVAPWPEFRPWLLRAVAPMAWCQYRTHNVLAQIDGSMAAVRAPFSADVGLPSGGITYHVRDAGTYVDELVRTADGWRVRHRVEEFIFITGLPPDFAVPE